MKSLRARSGISYREGDNPPRARNRLRPLLSAPRPLVGAQILREAAWVFGEETEVPSDRGSRECLIHIENVAARQNRAHESAVFRRRQDHAPIDWRIIPRGEFNQVLEDDRRRAEPV